MNPLPDKAVVPQINGLYYRIYENLMEEWILCSSSGLAEMD